MWNMAVGYIELEFAKFLKTFDQQNLILKQSRAREHEYNKHKTSDFNFHLGQIKKTLSVLLLLSDSCLSLSSFS